MTSIQIASSPIVGSVSEELKAKCEGASKDKHIGQIEDAGLRNTRHPNDYEIGYPTVTKESVQKIAEPATCDHCQWHPDVRVFLWKSQQVDKTCTEQESDKDIEKQKTQLTWQIADDSQETAVVFCQGKFD